jgi:hypothetical protein
MCQPVGRQPSLAKAARERRHCFAASTGSSSRSADQCRLAAVMCACSRRSFCGEESDTCSNMADCFRIGGCLGTSRWCQCCARCRTRKPRHGRRWRWSAFHPASSDHGFRTSCRADNASALPGVILLDEPFGALDAISRADLQESFGNMRRTLTVTTLLVTHDLAEAARLADEVVVMRSGRIEQRGSMRDLVQAPATDYVARLIEKARSGLEALLA